MCNSYWNDIGLDAARSLLLAIRSKSRDAKIGTRHGLTNVNGTLFGMTPKGGGIGCSSYPGCGAIFALLPNGPEIVVYSFTGGCDGSWQNNAMINVNGTLYGMTNNTNSNGLGTVFSLSF